MTIIAQNDVPCQEGIPFETGELYRNPADAEPVATPLADLVNLIAEREARKAQAVEIFSQVFDTTGDLFAADQAVIRMLREGNGATQKVEPKYIYIEEVTT